MAGPAAATEQGPSGEDGAKTGIVVAHTHWDREWYLPFQRFRLLLVETIDLLLDTLETRPDFASFMLDGQTVLVEDYLEARPERRDEFVERVRAGRIGVGPWYTLPDGFLPSPESLIRNLLLGRRQTAALGAPPAAVGYLPDSFGHPAQLPQILAGFDLTSAVVYRGVQASTSEFLWEAPDGSRLLTLYLPGGYFNAMELARAPRYWLEQRMRPILDQLLAAATGDAVLLMAGFDHLPPHPAIAETIAEANRRQSAVRLRQGTLAEYVALVRPGAARLPVRRGEWRLNRPSRITPGVLSSRMLLKQADFRASTLLERGAEPLGALAAALGWDGAGRHAGLLALAWRYLLQNHPHDSICGCSVDAVHADNAVRVRWAEEIGGDLVARAAAAIAGRVAPTLSGTAPAGTSGGRGVVLFNTLPRPRREVVPLRLHFLEPGARFAFADTDGAVVPHQEIARRPVGIQWDPQSAAFHLDGRAYPSTVVSALDGFDRGRWHGWTAEEVEVLVLADLPAGGWTTPWLVDPDNAGGLRTQDSGLGGEAGVEAPGPRGPVMPQGNRPESSVLSPQSSVTAGPDWLESDLLRVEVAADGSFALRDKTTGRRFGPLNLVRSEADRGDEYSFCPAAGDRPVSTLGGAAAVEPVERGPLRATLAVRLTLPVPQRLTDDRTRRVDETVDLPIVSRVSLVAGARRVEIETELDNRAEDHRLRALFATGVRTDVADAQGQFETVRRPVDLPLAERTRVPGFGEEQEVSYHPQRAFVDVSDEAGGLALLNRGLPEYEAEPGDDGVVLGLTLLRCVGWLSRDDLATRHKHAGPPLRTPDAQCPGKHRFAYAVVPHAGDWLAGGVAGEAEAYVWPVHAAGLLPTPLPGDALPPEHSGYALEPAELLFSACKPRDDGRGLILRAHNTAPHPVEAWLTVRLPGEVRLANLAEREFSPPLTPEASGATDDVSMPPPRRFRFPVRAHEIVTVSIRPRDE